MAMLGYPVNIVHYSNLREFFNLYGHLGYPVNIAHCSNLREFFNFYEKDV